MEETYKNRENNNNLFILKRSKPDDYDNWEFAMEMFVRTKYQTCSMYFETGEKENFDMEPME
jgi:hypothetical protein